MRCCVSTATMVTRTRHNITFTSIPYLVLIQYEAVYILQSLTQDCHVRSVKYTLPCPDHKGSDILWYDITNNSVAF